MPKPKKEQNSEVLQAISALAEGMKSFEERLKKIEEPKVQVAIEVAEKPKESVAEVMPFPPEWRAVIDDILNAKFIASVIYRGDARFEFTVDVPKEYSNARPLELEMNKQDRRVKVIDNALGTLGVREYCEKIAKNLGPDIMRMVNEQRTSMSSM